MEGAMSTPGTSEVRELVELTLAAMFRPELRGPILAEALQLEGTAEIPDDPERGRAFVEGPLRLVVKRRVGAAMSQVLMETLAPLFGWDARAQSYDRLPAFGEDDDDEETAVYDARSLTHLRRRLQRLREAG